MQLRPCILALAAAAIAGIAAAAPALAHTQAHRAAPTAAGAGEQQPWGIAGDPHAATRTIIIAMGDGMRFAPSAIVVTQGETVRFVVRNKGRLLHELVIGDRATLDAHAALMAKFPNMEHDEPYMAHVAPGRQASLLWTFNRAGSFEFACLVAGHYQAGMVGTVRVVAR